MTFDFYLRSRACQDLIFLVNQIFLILNCLYGTTIPMGTILLKDHQKDKRTKLINLKVTDKELALIQKKANRITGGNVSMWLRYAGMELEPPKRDLVKCRNK